eukprot:3338747-Rhodomonas_salina.1
MRYVSTARLVARYAVSVPDIQQQSRSLISVAASALSTCIPVPLLLCISSYRVCNRSPLSIPPFTLPPASPLLLCAAPYTKSVPDIA